VQVDEVPTREVLQIDRREGAATNKSPFDKTRFNISNYCHVSTKPVT